MKIVVTSLLLVAAFIITGCQPLPEQKLVPVFTVSFDPQGGTPAPEPMRMDADKAYMFPTELTRPGYIFAG